MKAFGYNSRESWIAITALFVIELLMPLLLCLAGIFYVIILDTYKVGRHEAVLPIATYGFVRTFTGPLVGYIGGIFGLRKVIFIGCCLEALGIFLSSFAKNVSVLVVTLGLIYGAGYALTNGLIPSVVKQHFNKNLSLSNGIVFTGGFLGAVIMTPVVTLLEETYGTPGMFLILSGIFLHPIPASIILRNPRNEERESRKKYSKEQVSNQNLKQSTEDVFQCCNNKENMSDDNNLTQVVCVENYQSFNFTKSLNLEENGNRGIVKSKELSVGKQKNLDLNELFVQKEDDVSCFNTFNSAEDEKTSTNKDKIDARKSIKVDRNGSQNETHIRKISNNEAAEIQVKSQNMKPSEESFRESFAIFCNPAFLLHMCIQSTDLFCSTLISTVIVDYARDKGLGTRNGSYFVFTTLVCRMIGCLSLNWICDRGLLTRVNFSMICFIAFALNLGFLVWANSFALMLAAYIIFGIFSGALTTVYPGMIVDTIVKHQQNMALSSRYTLYGLLSLLKSPLIGYFRGYLGSYDGIHYLAMALQMFCGLIVKLPQLDQNRRNKI